MKTKMPLLPLILVLLHEAHMISNDDGHDCYEGDGNDYNGDGNGAMFAVVELRSRITRS